MAKKGPVSKNLSVKKESDELVFATVERFFQHINNPSEDGRKRPTGAASVAQELAEEFNRSDLTRERIYPLIWEAVRRNFLVMNPPADTELQRKLINKFNLHGYLNKVGGEVFVTNTVVGNIAGHVNEAAAGKIIDLIYNVRDAKVEEARENKEETNDIRIHLGFGAGYAAEIVAKRLSSLTGAEKTPKLTLHALTSGGHYIEGQQKAPTTYFSFFDGKVKGTEFVGMFAPTVVPKDEFESLKSNPSFKLVYSQRNNIDILVTSLASYSDEDGLYKKYNRHLVSKQLMTEQSFKDIEEKEKCVGDVMFLPYSSEKALTELPLRSVTLFNIAELIEFARTPNKYVVLTCCPCHQCGKLKTEAIRPLLENKELRMWTHLVIDRLTAEALLA